MDIETKHIIDNKKDITKSERRTCLCGRFIDIRIDVRVHPIELPSLKETPSHPWMRAWGSYRSFFQYVVKTAKSKRKSEQLLEIARHAVYKAIADGSFQKE